MLMNNAALDKLIETLALDKERLAKTLELLTQIANDVRADIRKQKIKNIWKIS